MTQPTIQRAEHKKQYTVIVNASLQDERLSWKAKGLLAYLLSLPDDWRIYVSELAKHSKDGEAATRSAFKELIAAGYVIAIIGEQDDKGRFLPSRYFVHETPQKPDVENPHVENPHADNRQLPSTQEQSTHKPNNTHIPTECEAQAPPAPPSPEPAKPKTKKSQPSAVRVFREKAHRFPAKSWWGRLEKTIGENEDNLAFWGEVVFAYVGLGWNPSNVRGMLEFYERREIPNVNTGRRTRKGLPSNGAGPDPDKKARDAAACESFLRAKAERARLAAQQTGT